MLGLMRGRGGSEDESRTDRDWWDLKKKVK